jgi:hypothetical protein
MAMDVVRRRRGAIVTPWSFAELTAVGAEALGAPTAAS